MAKEHVCIITTVHYRTDSRIFYKQALSLKEAGYSVTLIVQGVMEEVVEGVRIVPLARPKNRWQRLFVTGWRAYNLARREKAAIYHFHDPEFIGQALLLWVAGKKVIYDVHEDYQSAIAQKDYLPSFLRKLLGWFCGKLEVLFAGAFEVVIAEKYYARRFPAATTVLNYPRPALFSFPLKREEAKQPYRLLYTGDINADRGAYIHAGLVNLRDDIEVFMIGYCSSELAEQLMALAGENRDRLAIRGIDYYVPFAEIMDFYRQGGWTAGLALFPPSAHYYEKELTKFFEYMGAGIPLLCSNFPTWQKIVEKSSCGLTVDPTDGEAVAAAIGYLIEHPEEVALMGKKGRETMLGRYNWSAEERKLLALYEKILSD